MRRDERITVQRTLVLTGGGLAEETGERFRELLLSRAGPVEAVAIVPTDPAAGEGLAVQISEALTAISPPSLAADLAQKGWALESVPEVILFLVLDSAVYGAAEAQRLQEMATGLSMQHLGLDAAILTLWLVADPAAGGRDRDGGMYPPPLAPDQTIMSQSGIFILTLLNEEGLRLADEAALAAVAANALWALVATPLRRAPEWLLANVAYSPPGQSLLATLGVACWSWDRRQTEAAFTSRWLRSIFSWWLAAPEHVVEEEEVTQWLEYRQLDAAGLSAGLLSMAERAAPPFAADAWRAPAPWQIRRLWREMKAEEEADQVAREGLAEQLSWRLDDWLETAAETMRAHVQSLLDDHPVGGVAGACTWTTALTQAYDYFCAALCRQAEGEATAISALASERGRFAGQLNELLDAWPQPNPLAWAVALARPWRWPRLFWRYRQVRRCGYELSQIMSHQARLRRQQMLTATCRRGMAALHQEARHLGSQAEEIGDMLRHLRHEISGGEDHDTAPGSAIPVALYDELIPDEAAEAEAAAAAVGGLGRHLTALDDRILDELRRLAAERLAGLDNVTAVEALAALCPSPGEWQQWWQALWAEAAPLWRYDETTLGAEARGRRRIQAWVCGAGVPELPRRLQAAVELPPDIQWHSSADRERILLLRLSNF